MNVSGIDQAILSVVWIRWMKVAMVIAKVEDVIARELPTGNERCELISKRIDGLVSDGHLAARGNTKNWRHSEVRRAGDHFATKSHLRQYRF